MRRVLFALALVPAVVLGGDTVPGAYRVTFPDKSGNGKQWACGRTAATELECIDLDAYVKILDETRAAAARAKSVEL